MTETKKHADWLFVLLEKGTPFAGWWLKIKSREMLHLYLSQTSSRYARAFQNFLQDKFYQTDLVTHGPHIQEAPLTFAAYLHAANNQTSMIESFLELADMTEKTMYQFILQYGHVYVNRKGGYSPSGKESQDFCHRKELVWPDFTKKDLKISQFPGGTHWYARIGTVDIKTPDKQKFNTYQEAREAAEQYLLKAK